MSEAACPVCGSALAEAGAQCASCGVTNAGPPVETNCPDCGNPLSLDAVCPACAETKERRIAPGAPAFTGPKRIGSYRILRELGSGGMGTVFEAHDEKMDRRVAIKLLSRALAPSGTSTIRFEREAWIAGKLDHPGLVRVFERGTWEDLSYYTMELIEGGSLHDVVSTMRRFGRDDRLGLSFGTKEYVQWAISQVISAARALEHAHRKGVVHRDIKPMNLLWSAEHRRVKITDFGLALDAEADRLSSTGAAMGTPSYMAPEQILGKVREIGPPADVYALGVTLFELLTLQLPFRGDSRQLYMDAVLTQEARRASKLNARVGRDLETVIRKALEKSPRDRYAGAGELADDLERVLEFRPIHARPPRWPERALKWARRRPIHATLAVVLAVAVPAVAVLANRAVVHRRLERQLKVSELARQLRWLGAGSKHREAVDVATSILEIEPRNEKALWSRAVHAMNFVLGGTKADEAGPMRARALEDARRLAALKPDAAWSHLFLAFVLEKLDPAGSSAAAPERALAAARRPAAPTAEDLYFDAMLAHDRGDHAQAVALFTGLIPRFPSDPVPIVYRALSYKFLGDAKRAIEDYRVAVALDPQDHFNLFELGRLLTQQGELKDGEGFLERSLEAAPADFPYAHEGLADNLLSQGREAAGGQKTAEALALFEAAEKHARQALAIRDDLPWSHLNLGASLAEQNRLATDPDPARAGEALAQYDRTLALAAADGSGAHDVRIAALHNRCDMLIQLGRGDAAVASCKEAVELEPGDAVNHYNLAGAHALAGRAEDALASLRKDFELGDRDWQYLLADPWFVSLHNQREFKKLVEEMRLAH